MDEVLMIVDHPQTPPCCCFSVFGSGVAITRLVTKNPDGTAATTRARKTLFSFSVSALL
jgi:hypothetical protein